MISQTFVKLLIFFLKGAPGATTWLLLSQSLRMSWPLRGRRLRLGLLC